MSQPVGTRWFRRPEACQLRIWHLLRRRRLGAICAWRSAKRSHCSWRRASASARLRAVWAAQRRRFRERSVATPPPDQAGSTAGRPRPSGMPRARPGVRRPPGWRRTRLCISICRTGSRARSRVPTDRSSSVRRQPESVGDTDGGNRAGGPWPGALSRYPAACGSTSRETRPCGSATRPFTGRSTSRGAVPCVVI